jgi:16S rRNA (cytosine967-C5)-methyltransferase
VSAAHKASPGGRSRKTAARKAPARRPAGRARAQGERAAPRDDGGRGRALELLLAVDRGRNAADLLTADDSAFVRELTLGTLRRRGTLDAVHDAYSRRRAEDLDPVVRAAVRLGLYQHLFLDGVPPHAIVAATVELLPSGGGAAAARRGYVNGLLRTVLRESNKLPEAADRGGASPTKRLHRPGRTVTFFTRPVFPDPARDAVGHLAALHSHPRPLVARWLARVGEAAALARLTAGNATAPLVLRPRAGRTDAEALVKRLAREGVASEVLPRGPGAAAVRVRPGGESALASRAFRDGLFSVQDPEQMDAVEILAPRKGEVIWDVCAAPGGKACQLAELLEVAGGGRVVATDSREARLARLRENVARLGLQNVQVAACDALLDDPPDRPDAGFDAVLVDAPCSNTAVLSRRPEARWRLEADTFGRLATLQRRLIAACSRHLAPHGRLIYSVCTHEPEEGEAHWLQPTASPFVWTAGAAELAALALRWRAEGQLADSAPPPDPDDAGEDGPA